jgi:hypothetical protein
MSVYKAQYRENNLTTIHYACNCADILRKLIFENLTTVKPRFKAPRFNAIPNLTHLIPFPQNFGRFFGRCSKNFPTISFKFSVF